MCAPEAAKKIGGTRTHNTVSPIRIVSVAGMDATVYLCIGILREQLRAAEGKTVRATVMD